MAPEQDVFRRVGRGGAGNYVPAADAARSSKDLEAQQQHQSENDAAPSATTSDLGAGGGVAGAARRAGRGGAGNYVEAERLPSARENEEHLAGEVNSAVASSLERKRGAAASRGMGGRGGAGNWNLEQTASADGGEEEEGGEGSKVQELERKVKEAVDKGLRMPDKVHHGRDKAGGSGR
ncbi:hypothetical protein PLIIFM63780_000782 [Purpureocillium lilacinum]|uniref:Uncharacterized protein n=1 Tax=Purpureocillium lilacinum TaxID=33203 RepID=A0A179H4T5_PURLI|nr:hypothetical protein VFPBJ_03536 [Purpureocillium lilacinum]PWI74898.1 uncharacterized protein PCL_08212 [Purpureocillium lilacinum]GJN77292.1 hypothetical protein PLIIFM63780_000782 [Purpureocillium lilacinum]